MWKPIVAAALWMLVGSAATCALAAHNTGNALFDSCNNPSDTSKQSYCLGYVAGVSEVLEGMHIICTWGRLSPDQIKDEVVKYLREHPEQRNMDADDLTSIALALAFPCGRPHQQ